MPGGEVRQDGGEQRCHQHGVQPARHHQSERHVGEPAELHQSSLQEVRRFGCTVLALLFAVQRPFVEGGTEADAQQADDQDRGPAPEEKAVPNSADE